MKLTTTASALPALALLAEGAAARVLQVGIARRSTPQPLARRANSAAASLLNNVSASAYVTTVKVGTPPQTLTLQLDTGSSDTWVTGVDASICQSGGCFYGSFDANKSSTFKDVAEGEFQIAYGDKTSASGDYFTDTFTMGDAKLDSLIMGLGTDTDIPFGLVGVGYPANEAIEQIDPSEEYVNLPLQLVKSGVIATPAYSLWLNDLDASTGSILFGGIDTDKYHGELTRLKLYPTTDAPNITEFVVALTAVTAVSSSGSDPLGSTDFPMAVLLDSGTTFTNLPTDLVDEIYTEVGAETDNDGNPLVPCSLSGSGGYFSFQFGGPAGAVVNVSMSELVLPGTVGKLQDGKDACQFAIYPVTSSSDPLILGDAFLRSAYVVYDLWNSEVALAQTDFNATSSNVVDFASQGATVPSSTPAPSQDAAALSSAAVTATPTSYAAQKGFASSHPTSSSSPSGSGGGKSAASRQEGIGGVTLSLFVAFLAGVTGFCLL